MEDEKFTNNSELEYPKEDDYVNIKVLNNNTRLLDEQKANVGDIQNALVGVAKESSEKNIENIVKDVQAKANTINSNVATNKANIENIKNTVNTVNGNANNINSVVGQLKTKIDTLETKITNINNKKAWFSYPNVKLVELSGSTTQYNSYTTVLNVSGSGYLFSSHLYAIYPTSGIGKMGIKIEVDGEVKLYLENNKTSTTSMSTLDYVGLIDGSDISAVLTSSNSYLTSPIDIINTDNVGYGTSILPAKINVVGTFDYSTTLRKRTISGTLQNTRSFWGKIISNYEYLRFTKSLKVSLLYTTNSQTNSSYGFSTVYCLD